MSDAKRDENFVPTLIGVSSADGVTPIRVYVDPVTHRLKVDFAAGGSGTVTTVSVVSANGFAGTVANASSTPAITLSTTVTGILQGNGTAISAATTTGTGSVVLATSPTLTTPNIGAATGTSLQLSGLTASEIVITDASKNLVSAAVATYPSLTELTYLKGVTSAVQTQINAKPTISSGAGAPASTPSKVGDIYIDTTGDDAYIAVGTASSSDWEKTNDGAGGGNVSKVGTPVDNQVGVWTGDGTIEGTAGLTFDGSDFIVTRVDAGLEGPSLQIYHDSATPASLDYLGDVSFYGRDGAANKQYYGGIDAYINDPTSTSEDSWLRLNWARAGSFSQADFGVDSSLNAMNGMTLGANGVDAIIQSKGNSDLILRTGNATTGNITITDGADGDITIAADGTGDVVVSASDLEVTGGNIMVGDDWSIVSSDSDEFITWRNAGVNAVNNFSIRNANTGVNPSLEAEGNDTNIGMSLIPKGTGNVHVSTGLELGHASDTTLSRSAAGVLAVEGVVIPSISSTNTLTNKRVTPRTGTTTSSATPTINTDNVDFYSLTAQTVAITSFTTNLSGTPTEGQKLWIAVTGTAARAITWGASFENGPVALPTTTVTTTRLDVGFIWNTVTSKWRCVASGSTV